MPIKAFIFDMDDVLCRYDVARRIARLAAFSGRSETDVTAAIWESDYFPRADRGDWSANECLREFGARLGFAVSRADWVAARREAMTPDPDMLAFVAALKAHAQIALLTNNDLLLADALDDVFPAIRPLFGPHCYVSAELRLAKPDPEIFRHIITRLDVSPHEALFVDDLPENVAGARLAGLHAIKFTGFQAFKQTLSAYDLPNGMLIK